MRRRLAATATPASRADATRLLHSVFREVVGVDIHGSRDESLYRAEFDSGGMSGGHVDLTTSRERLMPLLESRLAANS